MSLNKQITISEILNAISKHRLKAIITFLILMSLVLAVFLVLPREYGSEGRIFVQLGRTGTGLDPTAGKTSISIQDSRETEIRSVVEIARSRAILEAVVETVGPKKILASSTDFLKFNFSLPTFPWQINDDGEIAKEEYERLKEFEVATKKLENALSVHAEKKTSVISIYCKANSPQLAQKIVEEIMAETRSKHLDVNSVKGSTAFFEENFQKKQAILIRAENRRKEFRNENGILSIGGTIGRQQNLIGKLENELIDAEVNYSQSMAKLSNITSQMANIRPTVMLPRTGVEKLSTEDSQTELFKLQAELRQLEKKYNSEHPRLKPLQESVALLQLELKAMPNDRTESVEQSNPIYESTRIFMVNATAETKANKARWEKLKEKHQLGMKKLVVLNEKEIEATQLQRDLGIARMEMDIYVQKRSEAGIIDELDRKRISDVVIAQNANFVVKHVSPRGSVLVPLGALFAGICSIGMALYCERDLLSGHLTEEELEQILEIPVLVSLPTVSTQRNMVG